jgi:dTDP-4-dehydrorhamnose reductase
MKVAVVGGGSKISKYLYSSLQKEGIESIWFSSKPTPNWFEEGIWLNSPYTNEESFSSIVDEHKPTYVVNLNALADVDGCEDDKMLAMFLNYELPELFSKVCESKSVSFIHISTDYIFSGEKGLYEITDEPSDKNLNWYGITKRDGEEAVLKNFGCVIRTNFIYGDSLEEKSFISWVLHAISEKKNISIAYDQFSNPTHLSDLGNVIVLSIINNIKGIIHTGGKDWMSRWELAQVILLSKGIDNQTASQYVTPVSSLELNQKAIRPKFAGLGISKSEILLNYSFTGIYDFLLQTCVFKEDPSFEENPNYMIFKKLIFILKNIDNSVRKQSDIQIKKMDYGTISISINTEDYFACIEIGKSSYSGLLYEIGKEKEFSYKLIKGDVYDSNSILEFLAELNELFSKIYYP